MLPPMSFGSPLEHLLRMDSYPPLLSGLRGSHKGSYEAAHERAWDGKTNWGNTEQLDEEYDLVIVGAGISGLSAAWFYQQEYGADRKILILDNHDDFGGHARRNEFDIDGRMGLATGGSQTMENPSDYSDITKQLLVDLKIDYRKFEEGLYDSEFYKRNGLKPKMFFNKAVYGEDKLIDYTFYKFDGGMPGMPLCTEPVRQGISQMPISAEAKAQLFNVLQNDSDAMASMGSINTRDYLKSRSYFEFIRDHHKVTSEEVLRLIRRTNLDIWALGNESLSAAEAIAYGAPGLSPDNLERALGKRTFQEYKYYTDPYIHHFPDGNATIARLLVRRLIPGVGQGNDMEDVVTAKFRYASLDSNSNNVNIRLNSTVVHAEHEGSIKSSKSVRVQYIKGGKSYMVRGRKCIMACYNMMIPYLVPDLPDEQKQCLQANVKQPYVWTSVMLNNWRAVKDAQVGGVYSPGNMHTVVQVDFPVSIGDYKAADGPDEPIVLTMAYVPIGEDTSMPPKEQFKAGRTELLSLTFDDFETEIKEHLSGILGANGFDPEKDIDTITVNRWSHGYAYGGTNIFDEDVGENARKGRQRFGRISIANSDAGADALIGAAIDQAWRAVKEQG